MWAGIGLTSRKSRTGNPESAAEWPGRPQLVSETEGLVDGGSSVSISAKMRFILLRHRWRPPHSVRQRYDALNNWAPATSKQCPVLLLYLFGRDALRYNN